jgi:uncharacterized phage protein (TIGR02218 family)
MKSIPEALSAHLGGESTTLCRCWRLTRRDGQVLGFTDHDRDILVEGTVCEAGSGLLPGDMEQTLGFNADSQHVSGALVSGRISETDIMGDRYDGARVELWLVNWASPAERMLERVFNIGEIVREDGVFRAELRGAAAELDQTRGRLFQRQCDADLGDPRCGVDLDDPRWNAPAVISGVNDLAVAVSGLQAFATNHFRGGRIRFRSGANVGLGLEIADHQANGSSAVLALWKAPAFALAEGDEILVTAGCDKAFSTCRDRFANAWNFRGFPHMPGNDFVLGNATTFSVFDGKALIP